MKNTLIVSKDGRKIERMIEGVPSWFVLLHPKNTDFQRPLRPQSIR